MTAESLRHSNNWRFTNDKVNADPITVTDFTTGEGGDILDYSDLLKSASVNYNGENPFSTGHIKLVQSGKDTLFQFDADGTGVNSQLLTLAVLKNIAVNQLLTDNFTLTSPLMVHRPKSNHQRYFQL